jgi:hypothetical protein
MHTFAILIPGGDPTHCIALHEAHYAGRFLLYPAFGDFICLWSFAASLSALAILLLYFPSRLIKHLLYHGYTS